MNGEKHWCVCPNSPLSSRLKMEWMISLVKISVHWWEGANAVPSGSGSACTDAIRHQDQCQRSAIRIRISVHWCNQVSGSVPTQCYVGRQRNAKAPKSDTYCDISPPLLLLKLYYLRRAYEETKKTTHFDCSRPNPLCLTPPKGAASFVMVTSLIPTMPEGLRCTKEWVCTCGVQTRKI